MLVDIHHHLIYGVDDGAQTQEDMRAMLRKAAENGIRHVVATSHITPGVKPFPAEAYLEHLAEANDFCQSQALDLTIHVGSEILWTEQTPRLLREGQVPTLARTWTVLVEFVPQAKAETLFESARLLGNEGMRVIFAHIERYDALRDIKRIVRLKDELGVLMQMNCGTVLAREGFLRERWKKRVLEEGLIDMVATDAHSVKHRSCNMAACHHVLSERFGREWADELCGGLQARLLGFEDAQ